MNSHIRNAKTGLEENLLFLAAAPGGRARTSEPAAACEGKANTPGGSIGSFSLTPLHLGLSRSLVNRTLLLGLGNEILSDDAIGLNVVRALRGRLAAHNGIDVIGTAETGLSVLDLIVGYEALALVDAVQTGRAPPGFLHEIDGEALNVVPGLSPHTLGLGELLALGRELGLAVPRRVLILAVEVENPFTLGTQMTPALQNALPGIVERVWTVLGKLAKTLTEEHCLGASGV